MADILNREGAASFKRGWRGHPLLNENTIWRETFEEENFQFHGCVYSQKFSLDMKFWVGHLTLRMKCCTQ